MSDLTSKKTGREDTRLSGARTSARRDRTARRLGNYRVLKILGGGGMGMVFKAEDPGLQRTVALKVMLPELAQKSTGNERFLREARAAANIEYDHIMPIFQVDEDRGVPFIAMSLLMRMSPRTGSSRTEHSPFLRFSASAARWPKDCRPPMSEV
jgi:serine/threonine protein kinase